MKNAFTIGFGFVVVVVLPYMVQQGFAQNSEDRSADIYHGNITNDVRRLLNEDYYATALVQYVTSKNIPISDLSGVLKSFVVDGLNAPQGIRTPWFNRSIGAMGRLKMGECLPYLVEIANRPDCSNRSSLIWSISQIGGSNALVFAARVVNETNTYSLADRHHLYDCTIRHILSECMDSDIIRQPSEEERQMSLAFLVAEPGCEEKIDWVLHSDEYMAKLMPTYFTNEARVVFLSYFCTNAPVKFRSRFIERVNALRGVVSPKTEADVYHTGIETRAISTIVSNVVEKPTVSNQREISASSALLPTQKPRHLYVLWGFCLSAICLLSGIIIRIRRH